MFFLPLITEAMLFNFPLFLLLHRTCFRLPFLSFKQKIISSDTVAVWNITIYVTCSVLHTCKYHGSHHYFKHSPLQLTCLNKAHESPSPKNALCQVWLKLAQWFWRRRFLNSINVFSLFRNYLPLERGGTIHLKKLEFPSPKDALCQVWFKLAQWFWRRFLNFVNVFSLFRNYVPLEKGKPFI